MQKAQTILESYICPYTVCARGDGMIDTVKTILFNEDGGVAVHECRRCGTSVDTEEAACPNCGSDDITTVTTR